jgi:hypothetical protein
MVLRKCPPEALHIWRWFTAPSILAPERVGFCVSCFCETMLEAAPDPYAMLYPA